MSHVTLAPGTRFCTFLVHLTTVNVMDKPAATFGVVASQRPSTPTDLQPHLQSIDYPDSQDKLLQLLSRYRDVLALPGEPLGKTDVVQHKIQVIGDSKPVYVPAYRLPHTKRALVERTVSDMLNESIIKNSASPIFLVPKRSDEWRTVVDFREFNILTFPSRYPMPVLEASERKTLSSLP